MAKGKDDGLDDNDLRTEARLDVDENGSATKVSSGGSAGKKEGRQQWLCVEPWKKKEGWWRCCFGCDVKVKGKGNKNER